MLWLRGELRNPAINVKFYCDANFRTFGCQKLNALAARANFEIFHAKKMNFNCKFSHESLSYALNGARFWICSPRRFEWTNFFRKMFKNKKNHFFHGVRFDETWDDICSILPAACHCLTLASTFSHSELGRLLGGTLTTTSSMPFLNLIGTGLR